MDDVIEVGDLVEPHSRDLDPRIVTRIEGDMLWLELLTREAGPFPVDNYIVVRKASK